MVLAKFKAFLVSHRIPFKDGSESISIQDPWKERDPHFTMRIYDNGLACGFRSGKRTGVWKVASKLAGVSYREAVNLIGEPVQRAPEVKPEPDIQMPDYCLPIWDLSMGQTESWRGAVGYLARRGFTSEDLMKYVICYCWAGRYDGRVVLPYFEDNRLVFWTARDFTGKSDLRYMFPKGGSAGKHLFGCDHHSGEEAILCEGQFDAMTIGGMALGGKALTSHQLTRLQEMGVKSVILAIDNDNSGYEMLHSVASKLDPIGIKIRWAVPEGGKDWNEIGREKSLSILRSPKPYSLAMKYLIRKRT